MTAVSTFRQAPLGLRVYELRAVLPLLPRLRCGACRGKVVLEPPSLAPGVLSCQDCGREFNRVVYELHPRPPLTSEEIRPRRGRPPKVAT